MNSNRFHKTAGKKPICPLCSRPVSKCSCKKKDIYLFCPKAGNPRKHISVCRKCRKQKKCSAFQTYLQPELPFKKLT